MRPYAFHTEPMDHQRRALRAILQRQGVCGLLMDPGTGKSKVVIDYLAMLYLARGAQDWLITAPLSALDGWPDQFEQHLPEGVKLQDIWMGDGAGSIEAKAERIRNLPPNPGVLRVVLINHDAFGSKSKATGKNGRKLSTVTVQDRLLSAIESWGPDGLVVDESHRAKSHTANRSKALQRIARLVPQRILLTGTVAPRNLLDIFGQWLILNPKRFGSDWHQFRYTYARWGGYMNKEPVAWLNTEDMRDRILADAFIIKKEDALDLPPVTEITVPVQLSPSEEKAYIAMGEDMLAELPSGETSIAPIPITKLMRLRQLTGGFVGYGDGTGERAEERLGTSKAKVCIEKLTDLVDAGEKVVVFAHFRPDLDILEELAGKALPKATPIYRIDGSTPKGRRMEYRTGFRDHEGAAVFLAQMRTMSLGVNELVVSSYGIVYSMSERRDDLDQALDRLDRQGQTRPVTIYHLTVPDSVDELLLDGHRAKLDLEKAITTTDDARRYLTLGSDR